MSAVVIDFCSARAARMRGTTPAAAPKCGKCGAPGAGLCNRCIDRLSGSALRAITAADRCAKCGQPLGRQCCGIDKRTGAAYHERCAPEGA